MRFAFFAVFLCVGAKAICQSTAPAYLSSEAAEKNPAVAQPWADFSKLPPEMSFSNTAQLDLKGMLRASALNVQAQPLLLAQNGFPSSPMQSQPRPKAKLIPIPTEWPNAAVKRIPTEWPDLKLQKTESQSSKFEVPRSLAK
jgi:hypothetical protein